jgi:aspartokinase
MMQTYTQKQENRLTLFTINSMVEVLNAEIRKNPELANDLLKFLEEHKINVIEISQKKFNKTIPVSFSERKSTENLKNLKSIFDDIDTFVKI